MHSFLHSSCILPEKSKLLFPFLPFLSLYSPHSLLDFQKRQQNTIKVAVATRPKEGSTAILFIFIGNATNTRHASTPLWSPFITLFIFVVWILLQSSLSSLIFSHFFSSSLRSSFRHNDEVYKPAWQRSRENPTTTVLATDLRFFHLFLLHLLSPSSRYLPDEYRRQQ